LRAGGSSTPQFVAALANTGLQLTALADIMKRRG
jgi:hypothetical protein